MLKIALSRLDELFTALNGEMPLYLPIEEAGLVLFRQWTPKAKVRLDLLNTAMSPKNFFFQIAEDIATFKLDGNEINISENTVEKEPFVLFGVRACDYAGITHVLDNVFLKGTFSDTFYQARRQNSIIISLGCSKPEETCFCGTFDIDATDCPHSDVKIWIDNEYLYWKSASVSGQNLTEKVRNLFEQSDDKAIKEQMKKTKEILAKLPFAELSLAGLSKDTLLDLFDSPQWQSPAQTCLSCSTCTFICPTCHCYDVQDFDTGAKVKRFRCWDSCMNADFTQMAHGNPRPGLMERFRQRYMHKLVYFPENNDGKYACTGCGRCVKKCPISMNIVKVVKELTMQFNQYLPGEEGS